MRKFERVELRLRCIGNGLVREHGGLESGHDMHKALRQIPGFGMDHVDLFLFAQCIWLSELNVLFGASSVHCTPYIVHP